MNDIERINFWKEIEAETKKAPVVKPKVITNQMIEELFCEATKRFGTTLKKLAEN